MTSVSVARSHSKLDDLFQLVKIRLNSLVVVTAAGGYYMAAPTVFDPMVLVATCLGTGLVAGGAAALNQVRERDIDQQMDRTKDRPVASGRMTSGEAIAIAGVATAVGFAMLWLVASMTAALVAVATLVIYLVIYTPMKRLSSLSTVVGAIPGALPPVIGWTAAGGTLASAAPWSLFLIMFVWQLPHFLAIAWLYREDYARAGLPMLPVVDRQGVLTGGQAALWAATLVPVTLLPYLLRFTTGTYAIAALVLGIAFLVVAVRFMLRRTDDRARALFYGSITYLPLLFGFMGAGRV